MTDPTPWKDAPYHHRVVGTDEVTYYDADDHLLETRARCNTPTSRGALCSLSKAEGRSTCRVHKTYRVVKDDVIVVQDTDLGSTVKTLDRCPRMTIEGTRCRMPTLGGEGVCIWHLRAGSKPKVQPTKASAPKPVRPSVEVTSVFKAGEALSIHDVMSRLQTDLTHWSIRIYLDRAVKAGTLEARRLVGSGPVLYTLR